MCSTPAGWGWWRRCCAGRGSSWIRRPRSGRSTERPDRRAAIGNDQGERMSSDLTFGGSTSSNREAQTATGERAAFSQRWLVLCGLGVLILGALQAWNIHWVLDPDGVAYLDM